MLHFIVVTVEDRINERDFSETDNETRGVEEEEHDDDSHDDSGHAELVGSLSVLVLLQISYENICSVVDAVVEDGEDEKGEKASSGQGVEAAEEEEKLDIEVDLLLEVRTKVGDLNEVGNGENDGAGHDRNEITEELLGVVMSLSSDLDNRKMGIIQFEV